MTKNEMRLAATMLDLAADNMSGRSCDDSEINIVGILGQSEAEAFTKKFHEWNDGLDPREWQEGDVMTEDWVVMIQCARLLRHMAKQ